MDVVCVCELCSLWMCSVFGTCEGVMCAGIVIVVCTVMCNVCLLCSVTESVMCLSVCVV